MTKMQNNAEKMPKQTSSSTTAGLIRHIEDPKHTQCISNIPFLHKKMSKKCQNFLKKCKKKKCKKMPKKILIFFFFFLKMTKKNTKEVPSNANAGLIRHIEDPKHTQCISNIPFFTKKCTKMPKNF